MNEHEILIEATKKLIDINNSEDWKNELLSKAPPVLWFGNSNKNKEKVLTLGANPSRWEFLDQSSVKASCSKPYQKSCYEGKYLSKQRFYHLEENESYNDILKDKKLRDKIIDSLDQYFMQNPYKWFGSNKDNSYNVEGVLRGLNASYFESDHQLGACHIDIFPFATITDFNQIQRITKRDILDDLWAKNVVDQILNYFNPKLIFVFGRTNFNYFCTYFGINARKGMKWKTTLDGKGKCEIWHSEYGEFKVVGVSTNLGNPNGFDAKGLRELGTFIKENVISD